jgi:hypothetical protein
MRNERAVALSILAAVMLLSLVVIAKAQQQKKIPRMGFLAAGSPSLLGFDELQQGLRELGYDESVTERKQLRWKQSQRRQIAESWASSKITSQTTAISREKLS